MQTETKKFATYQNASFDRAKPVEVKDEQDAVRNAGNNLRFNLHEQFCIKVEGKMFLESEPQNHTPYIYTNVEAVLSVADVIAARQAQLAAEQGDSLKDEFSRNMSVNIFNDLIADLQNMDPATCYIKEPESRGEFIRLEEGEKAYNAQGQQLYPAPAQDAAPDVTPAL